MADDHVDKKQKDSDESEYTHWVVNIVHGTNKCAENATNDEAPSIQHYRLLHSVGQEGSRDVITHEQVPRVKQLLGRPLGGLEIVYHHAMSKGMDMICLMTKLSTTFPIIPELAKRALYCLAEQHPLLRMTIQRVPAKTSNQLSFLEMDEIRIDFAVDRGSWLSVLLEEVAKPFDIAKGPLWKCRLLLPHDKVTDTSKLFEQFELNSCSTKGIENESDGDPEKIYSHPDDQNDDFVHEATFLFAWHHSIMDGGYVVSIFKEFAKLLDNLHARPIVDSRLSVSLPPPLEHVLHRPSQVTKNQQVSRQHFDSNVCAQNNSSVRPDSSHSWFQALDNYNQRFSHEIARDVHTSPRNGCMTYEFNEKETERIMQKCRSEGATANGLFSTACVLAFIDLIYPVTQRSHFGIPFEFMLDFRKHLPLQLFKGSRKYFEGVASIHVPMMADIQLSNRPVTKTEFWEMSRSFGSAIQIEVDSQETFQWMKDLVKENTSSSKQLGPVGKSPYVLCLSNMGRLDGVLTGDITKRMRLTGLHGHPTVLIDNNPIFFVSIFLLNGKLCGNVSFCENYTSRKTAAEYIGHLKKQILMQAKL